MKLINWYQGLRMFYSTINPRFIRVNLWLQKTKDTKK